MTDKDERKTNMEDVVDTFEEIEIEEADLQQVIPAMNVSVPAMTDSQTPSMVTDEDLMGTFDEIMRNLREDRVKADSLLEEFAEMVINGGDASSASKEALVNLLKIKSDTADKMSKIAELKTRVKLKDRDTFPRYLAAKQNNTINITSSKKALITELSSAQRKTKKITRDEYEQ